MAGPARAYLAKYYAPASAESGLTRPITLNMLSGPWDTADFRAHPEGMAVFEWAPGPNGIKFRAAMAKLNGGEENARKIRAGYRAMIASRSREFGWRQLPPTDD